jgi:tetratricopeptide (TPR) repeat protein
VTDAEDLDAFRRAWLRDRDGWSGRRYAEALEAAGEVEAALEVCQEMWDLGYPAGRADAAWIEHDRGDAPRAIALMTDAAEVMDDEDRPLALGVLGHWRWHHFNDVSAEPLLRSGMSAYPDARADLAELLVVTGRRAEGRQLLVDGVEAGLVDCMLPLANLLGEEGDAEAAERLYRRAYASGDAHSAWNLAVLLHELGRHDEAEDWEWRAARGGDEVAIAHLTRDGMEQ